MPCLKGAPTLPLMPSADAPLIIGPQPLPPPQAPLVDPATGLVDPVWHRFFQSMLARTGGPLGVDAGELDDGLGLLQGLQGDAPEGGAEGDAPLLGLSDPLPPDPVELFLLAEGTAEPPLGADFLLALSDPPEDLDLWAPAMLLDQADLYIPIGNGIGQMQIGEEAIG